MEIKLLILSVACFSCLIPSAVSFNLLAAHAVAHQAAQDLAAIKANTISAKNGAVLKAFADIADITTNGLALKGQAIKKAAVSVFGSLLNGIASAGSTLARAGLDIIAAKFGLLRPPQILPPKPDCVIKPPHVLPPMLPPAVLPPPVLPPVGLSPIVPAPPQPIEINRPDNIIPSLHLPSGSISASAQFHHPLIYPPVAPQRSFYRRPANHYGFRRPAGSRFAIMDMPRFDAQAFEATQYGKK
ncbi:unnamed protein product [Chrysodeixis includens]|uniref:Uncharacterized protein n=1 Tax=Chrysodeixis includens TaxID=689277 RepID=A0A9P0BUK8_CHRIL|nr:unnamed protein product [Chrysodeixis includens]